jgi:starvation-inducible DNA-binding protein
LSLLRICFPPARTHERQVITRTRNTPSKNVRSKSAAILNRHLAATIDLHAQVKRAHWNVRGSQFIGLHELFDGISDEVEDWSDLLAERAGALGSAAEGTIQIASERSHLSPYPLVLAPGKAHVEALVEAVAAFGGEARSAIDDAAAAGDPVTSDVLTEIVRAADQALWKLEAHTELA